MNARTILLLPTLLWIVGCTSTGAPKLDPTVDFSGRWKNQRGSIVELHQDASSGALTGHYTTYVGGPGGRPFTRTVVGQARGDQVTFYVDWSPYSMTGWVGQLLSAYGGDESLDTMWVNTVNVPNADEPADGWSGVRNGGDRFVRHADDHDATPSSPSSDGLDPPINFSGEWKNQRGSIVELHQDASTGSLTGSYTTFVGGPDGNHPFTKPLVGQARGDQATFYVDWSPYSMVTWVGQLLTEYGGEEKLDTVWLHTANIRSADEPEDGWSGIRNGADSFERIR